MWGVGDGGGGDRDCAQMSESTGILAGLARQVRVASVVGAEVVRAIVSGLPLSSSS